MNKEPQDTIKTAPTNQKEYSIWKEGFSLFTSLLMGWVLCIILFLFTVGLMEYTIAKILSVVFLNFILVVFLYAKMWERGDKDNNIVSFGHMQYDRWRGLKIGAIAAIPGAFFNLLLVVFKLADVFPFYITIYKIINIQNIHLINSMTNTALAYDEIPMSTVLILFSFVLLIPLLSAGVYWLGYKRISVGERVVYVNGKRQRVKKHPRPQK